jgi:PAS domain S-box-containing protein
VPDRQTAATATEPLKRRAADRRELATGAERLVRAEQVMIRVRWAAVVFAFVQIFTFYKPYPSGAQPLSIAFAVLLALGNAILSLLSRRIGPQDSGRARNLALASLGLDVVVVTAFVFVYAFDPDTAIWALIYVLPMEGAIRFQRKGALWTMSIAAALYVVREIYGTAAYGNEFLPTSISFRMGVGFIIAAVGGTMASNLVRERGEIERHADALRESEERFRNVFEVGPIGIALVGPANNLIDANDAFCSLVGCVRGDIAEKTLPSFIHPEDVDLDERDRAAMFGGRINAYSVEKRFVRADGSTRVINMMMSAIRDRDGAVRYGLAMASDVTERRRAERSLLEALAREQAAAENLRQTDTFKTTLLSAVSHDLRTPLTIVLGFAEQLQRELDSLPPADIRTMIDPIVANAHRLERLIQNLLDMDRLTRTSVRPKLEDSDLASISQRVVASLELPGRSVELVTDPAPALLDVALVERILENLVINVTRHTPAGTPLTVRTWTSGDEVLLAVEDRGPGVPRESRTRIFEAFERGAADHSPGTGVGLSLVHRFAELHGGRAWVEDRIGGGASFRVALPRGGPAATEGRLAKSG